MNILLFDMGSYTYNDVLECFRQMGHSVRTIYYSFQNRIKDDFFEERFKDKVKADTYDVIFSINFFPIVAKIANEFGIPYISWSYDSPIASELVSYFNIGTNYIFLFDREETASFRQKGYNRVFHMPLATNAERLEKLKFTEEEKKRYSADISFVGQLYEDPVLSVFKASMDEYSKGYIDALLAVQINTYGADLITGVVDKDLIDRINNSRALSGLFNELSANSLVFSIHKQLTFAERVTLLTTFGQHFNTKYYNTSQYDFGTDVRFMGPVKYLTEMPAVFRYSKLNLCPTMRSILSGIPLRALDVMGSGGTLLSNYQQELAESFQDGESVIMYGSMDEAFDKASYYLKHNDERERIAQNGFEVVKKDFKYEDRLKDMLSAI